MKKLSAILLLTLLLFTFLSPGCSPQGGSQEVIICKIGDDVLTRTDFKLEFIPIYNTYVKNGMDLKSDNEKLTQLQESVFNSMVQSIVYDQLCDVYGITLTGGEEAWALTQTNTFFEKMREYYAIIAGEEGAEDIDQRTEQLMDQRIKEDAYPSYEAYHERKLQEHRLDIAVEKMYEYLTKDIGNTEAEIQQYFEAGISKTKTTYLKSPSTFEEAQNAYDTGDGVRPAYIPEGYVRVKHILVSDESLALELYQRAIDGEDFDALVAEYGTDSGMQSEPNKTLGYLVGPGSNFVWEFKEAALSLQNTGDIFTPVQSEFGYHIIKLTDRLEPYAMSWEEAKAEHWDTLVAEIKETHFQEIVSNWYDSINIVSYISRISDIGLS